MIRNSNHTLDKVLAQQGKGPQPTSKRELAVAQLEATLRKKRLAKSTTATHHTGVTFLLHKEPAMICPEADVLVLSGIKVRMLLEALDVILVVVLCML